jgi:hypothetical protein
MVTEEVDHAKTQRGCMMLETAIPRMAPETRRLPLLYEIAEHQFRLRDFALEIGLAYLCVGDDGSAESLDRLARAEHEARVTQSHIHSLRLQIRGLTS